MAAEYQAPAEACLRNAQILASTDAAWSYYLGQLYLASGERAKASESFERALKLRPTDFPTLVRLGGTYLDEDRTDAAERVFAQAVALQPQSAAALGGLGRAVLARGDAARAAEHLQRALTIEPEATSLHYPLAMAYRSLGDLKQADAHLRLRGRGEPTLVDPLMAGIHRTARERGELSEPRPRGDAGVGLCDRGGALPARARARSEECRDRSHARHSLVPDGRCEGRASSSSKKSFGGRRTIPARSSALA